MEQSQGLIEMYQFGLDLVVGVVPDDEAEERAGAV